MGLGFSKISVDTWVSKNKIVLKDDFGSIKDELKLFKISVKNA